MLVSFFSGVYTPQGTVKECSFSELFENEFKKIDYRQKKDGRLFSPANFNPALRHINCVKGFDSIVLDFDNDNQEKKCIENPSSPDDVLNELEEYECIYHSSFSHTETHPKWRLIIPFSRTVLPEEWERVFKAVVELIGNPDGIDFSSIDKNRAYYLPACPFSRSKSAFSVYQEGLTLNVDELLELPETNVVHISRNTPNFSTSGRNNSLKSQVSACLSKGIPFDQTVLEVIEYDKANHTPPLFEDPSEGNLEGNPEAGAIKFVSNIWFSHARNHGATPKMQSVPAHDIKALIANKKETKKEKYKAEFPEDLCYAAPGIVGEIVSWITETAIKPQPALSLGAALCCVGMLKAHRVQTETGLRTNLYILGLGPSGSGKEHPSRAIQLLLNSTDNGIFLSGEPGSDAGLLKSLYVNQGRTLIQWDEIGHALSSLTNARAGGHEKRIIQVMMKLFTKANSTATGREFANYDGKMERRDIEQPCLCVWGTTVAERFFQALTSDYATDGFLPRWLIFQIADPDVPEADIAIQEEAPEYLCHMIRRICELPTNVRSTGNLDLATRIKPAIVPLSKEAQLKLAEYKKYFNSKKITARKEGRGLDAVWNRGIEHTLKLALTVADINEINLECLNWAFKVVDHCIKSACYTYIEKIADSQSEARIQKLYEVIEKAGEDGITKKELYIKTRWAVNDRIRLLNDLILSEKVLELDEKTKGRNRKRYLAI